MTVPFGVDEFPAVRVHLVVERRHDLDRLHSPGCDKPLNPTPSPPGIVPPLLSNQVSMIFGRPIGAAEVFLTLIVVITFGPFRFRFRLRVVHVSLALDGWRELLSGQNRRHRVAPAGGALCVWADTPAATRLAPTSVATANALS